MLTISVGRGGMRVTKETKKTVSQTMSISTKNGEAMVLSFTTEGLKQENGVLTFLDSEGEEAATLILKPGTTHRIL